MRRYAARRLLIAIPVLFLVTLMAASLTRLAPGDAILQRVAEAEAIVTVEELEALRHEVGLDRPFLFAIDVDFPFIHPSEGSQYFSWVGGIFKGDLGTSLSADQRPIATILKRAIPVSLELAIIATLISLVVAIPIGIYSAIRQDSVGDYGGRIFAIAGLSVPDFIIGTLVLTLGAIWFKWTPPRVFERKVERARRRLELLRDLYSWLGLTRRARRAAVRLRGLRRLAEFADVYGFYVERGPEFETDNSRALLDALAPVDRDRFSWDIDVVAWRDYFLNAWVPGLMSVAGDRPSGAPVKGADAASAPGQTTERTPDERRQVSA